MILSLDQMQALAAECAPGVAAETLLSVAKVESGFDPLTVGVNGSPVVHVRANTRQEAIEQASALIAAGRSVDLGLGQINSGNLEWLGLSVAEAFDPCRNLAASARVLADGYSRGASRQPDEQPALRTALSYYNSGNPERGFSNGYVARVTRAAAQIVPAIQLSEGEAPQPKAAAWDVFGSAAAPASFVIRLPEGDQP